MSNRNPIILFALLSALAACGDDDNQTPTPDAAAPPDGGDPGADANPNPDVPFEYAFPSRFVEGANSVSYGGQVLRNTLIVELTNDIEGLTAALDDGTLTPAAGEIEQRLDFYYQFDETGAAAPLTITTTPALSQASYDAIASARNLRDKIAGLDSDAAATQHKDWATEFVGWTEGDVTSPDSLIRYWFGLLDDMAVARAAGTIPTDPDGQAITKVYVTAKGQDLKQLIQKFLLGAVSFSQATDDYLDDVTAEGGLNVVNAQDGENPYSTLEHHWDEAFGYFGAARDYNAYSDDELAAAGGRDGWSKGYHDTNGDQEIDLLSEYNFSFAANAGKRDRESAEAAPTDFTRTIFDAFLKGRSIIWSATSDTLPQAEREALLAQRDIIVENWEKVIAATVVHYINATLRDTLAFGTDAYVFLDHAKNWSEMKGFGLALQFNPRSPLSDEDFARVHGLLGDAPVLENAEPAAIEAYKAGLLEARGLLQEAYEFDAANIGDESGQNGW